MLIRRVGRPLPWPPDDLPLAAVARDWDGVPLAPPARFALVVDPERLWLVAARAAPAEPHPAARPGAFVEGLWRFDVAELFVGRRDAPGYVELNLAPNGAWWSCAFREPRTPRGATNEPLPGVRTHADPPGVAGWRAALGVPLAALREHVGFDDRTTANVTFVLDTPAARFVTAAPPLAGPPEFHAPALRRPVRITSA